MTEPLHEEEEPAAECPLLPTDMVKGWFEHGTLSDRWNNNTPLRGVVTAVNQASGWAWTISYSLTGRNGRAATFTTTYEDFRRRVCGKWLG